MLTLVRLEQPEKAFAPMVVTVSGIFTEVMVSFPLNAPSAIPNTGSSLPFLSIRVSGMTTSVSVPL
jgi:hypothetical protein